jgi:hypothetical protein
MLIRSWRRLKKAAKLTFEDGETWPPLSTLQDVPGVNAALGIPFRRWRWHMAE